MTTLLIGYRGVMRLPPEGNMDEHGGLLNEDRAFQIHPVRLLDASSTLFGVLREEPLVLGGVYQFEQKVLSEDYHWVTHRFWTDYLEQLAGADPDKLEVARALREIYATFGSVACQRILGVLESLYHDMEHQDHIPKGYKRMTLAIIDIFRYAAQDPAGCGAVQTR